jgi:poly-gamma-glutamate synthesis protein (capsule biosynthesis protein)
MKSTHIVQSLLLGVLVVQLLHINVNTPVFEYAQGDFAQRIEEELIHTSSPSPLSVAYVAQKQPFDSLIFVGDVLLARNIEFLMNDKGVQYPYRGLSFAAFAKRPAVVGNFESSVPQVHVPTPTKNIRFSVSASYIPGLALAGFTHFSLANNHAFDFSDAGYINAQNTLERNQLVAFGHPNHLNLNSVEFIELQNKVISVIAVHTLQQLPTYSDLKEVFQYASARSDLQLVYVHWGSEYVSVHNSRQREAAERFVDAGADVVVGHHPHVVQDIELINGVPVFYSLGNYIFDQYDTVDTQEGLVLHLELSNAQPRISLLPVTSVGTLSQPRFMQTKSHAAFLEKLAKRSDPELRKSINSGHILLDMQVASSSKVAMMSL